MCIRDSHRVLCFQLKSLGKALKEIGLLIMQDAVWHSVTANRSKHKTTWFYIDEFHLLLKGQTGSFSVETVSYTHLHHQFLKEYAL